MSPRFENKTIMVTGAGTGIGKATAMRLAKEGANLALLGRRFEPLQALANEITELGGMALPISCDIAVSQSLISAIEKIISRFGSLHGVFANAGVLGEFKPLPENSLQDFDNLVDVNLKGTFLTLKHCLPFLDRGSVVINASWTAQSVMPGAGAYASTKGALLAMTKTLAVEQGALGVRVNAINPGIILTPMADEVLDADLSRKLAEHTALKRNGVPDDVSGTVAWLLSDDSAFITGQEITIDGGYTIGGVRL
ncbi:MAG: SDR family NAD(P)-dependent oxidoreductase [Paraglaciecola sp.]|uniref:SDR family NAD(P)-dependent oxidoreductase n=1 Tax=Paraglaciecola sp. TaxID=1920173 RepID=UPI0032995775